MSSKSKHKTQKRPPGQQTIDELAWAFRYARVYAEGTECEDELPALPPWPVERSDLPLLLLHINNVLNAEHRAKGRDPLLEEALARIASNGAPLHLHLDQLDFKRVGLQHAPSLLFPGISDMPKKTGERSPVERMKAYERSIYPWVASDAKRIKELLRKWYNLVGRRTRAYELSVGRVATELACLRWEYLDDRGEPEINKLLDHLQRGNRSRI